MRPQTRHFYDHGVLAAVEAVSRSSFDRLRIADIARDRGVSEDHFAQLFKQQVGESLGRFIRRMRLESAAFQLRTTAQSVEAVAFGAGYGSQEAFARAFSRAYGCAPSQFRTSAHSGDLPSPSGIHWSPDEVAAMTIDAGNVALEIRRLPGVEALCIRHVGDYGRIGEGWARLAEVLQDRVGDALQWIAIYHDDGKRLNDRDKLRADIGFVARAGELAAGLTRLQIPAGFYVQTRDWIDSSDHVAAWDVLNERWVAKSGARPQNIPAYEIYDRWPLPWLSSRLRIALGLELDMGDPDEL